MDDSQIVELYLSRDEAAITETSQKYGNRLRMIANNVIGEMEIAKECENDTYFKTWSLIPPNEPRTYLFSFLGKITRNLAIDRVRHEGSQKRSANLSELTLELSECIPGQSDVASEVDAKELISLINSFLKDCSEEQRKVFVRRYWYFDSVADICKAYSLPQSKVKTMLFRMREKLKEQLNAGGYSI